MRKSKPNKWSANGNRRIQIENGRFGTVITQQNTKHINFGNVYYISNPIPEDQFAETLGLWNRGDSSSSSSTSTNALTSTDDDDAYYRGDTESLSNNSDDVWVQRSDAENSQASLSTWSRCTRETVLQNTWHNKVKKNHGRPLPSIPRKDSGHEIPGWYDSVRDNDTDNTSVSANTDEASVDTFKTNFGTRGSSVDDMSDDMDCEQYAEPDDRISEIFEKDLEQTRPKQLGYRGNLVNQHPRHVPKRIRYSLLPRPPPIPPVRVSQKYEYRDSCVPNNKEKSDDGIPVSSNPVGGLLIKQLTMPSLEWPCSSENVNNAEGMQEIYEDEYDSTNGPPAILGDTESMVRRVESITVNTGVKDIVYDEEEEMYEESPPPPVPPRIPLIPEWWPHKVDKEEIQDCSEEEIDLEATKSDGTYVQPSEGLGKKGCTICQKGNIDKDALSGSHQELHRLLEKVELLTASNEVDRAKKEVRRDVNDCLKERHGIKEDLHELEMEELEHESAIENIGKHSQLDEYYSKTSISTKTRQTKRVRLQAYVQTDVTLKDQVYAMPKKEEKPQRELIVTKFEKKWSFRSTFKHANRKSFSSKIYVADSGIDAE